MHIRGLFINILNNIMQISAAIIITLIQRWLLELSTFEKDWQWFTRQRIYGWFARARWYRGMEAYHQWNAHRIMYAQGN